MSVPAYRTLRSPDDPAAWRLPLRTFSVREAQADSGNRFADGLALEYGTLIAGYDEVITQGAFEDTIVPLIRGHDGSSARVARAMLINNGGLYEFEAERVPDSQAAADAFAEMAYFLEHGDEVDVSLGFRVSEYRSGDELTPEERAMGAFGAIDKAEARELSLVVDGAAPGAMVTRTYRIDKEGDEAHASTDERVIAQRRMYAARARRIMTQRRTGVRQWPR